MIRGLNLTLAALVVASLCVTGAFAFTPAVSPIPDVIQGDQTPVDGLTPGAITGAGDTRENQLPGADIYEFENAFNVFDYVADNPNTPAVAGFTSDENMTYEFIATPVDPVAGTGGLGDARVSINGVTISTSLLTAVNLSIPASAELDFANIEHSSAPVGVGAVPESSATLDYTFGPSPYHPDYTGPNTDLTGVDLVDSTAISLQVTNGQGNSDEQSFMVYTVDNAPDALIPGLGGPVVPQDLNGWTYQGAGSTAGILGPSFAGDTAVTGVKQADDDSDSSVVDLNVAFGDTNGDSFVNWASPLGLLAFSPDVTYRIDWTVSRGSGFTTATGSPNTRFRHSNDLFGSTSSGLVNAISFVAGAFTDGRTYTQVFDQLDLAAATGTISFGGNDAAENGAQLIFETVDLVGGVGAASNAFLELDDVGVASLNRAALVAAGTLENQVTDWTSGTQVSSAGLGVNFSNAPNITITPSVGSVAITAPSAGGTAVTPDAFGNSPAVQVAGIGFVPFAPTMTANAFFRAEYDIDFSGSTGTNPMSRVRLGLSTQVTGGSNFQTEYDIDANLNPLGGLNRPNPGLAAGTFACYLALPEGATLDPGDVFDANDFTWMGDLITASVRVIDSAEVAEQSGTITVTNMTLSSFPESILP